MPPHNYSSSIKNHWAQIIITNIMILKKCEVLWELPKCDTETQNEQVLLGNGSDRLAPGRVARNLPLEENTVSVKWIREPPSKTRGACLYFSVIYFCSACVFIFQVGWNLLLFLIQLVYVCVLICVVSPFLWNHGYICICLPSSCFLLISYKLCFFLIFKPCFGFIVF